MEREFFRNLPSEIVIDILSRLPVRTIIHCKCVCKSWLDLVGSLEFAKSHLSKSVSGLAVLEYPNCSDSYKIFEFEDGLDLENHVLHYNLVTEFNLPAVMIQDSVNGLLWLRGRSFGFDPFIFYICNPITREYIEIHCPREFARTLPDLATYGFGASKITGQHKVVRIFHGRIYDQTTGFLVDTKSECQVYTLGMGSWRNIAPSSLVRYRSDHTTGAFLNGNLHWLAYDSKDSPWISCFDLETEVFSTCSPPPISFPRDEECRVGVFALGDCLCLSDNTSNDDIVIWLMKEYGDEKSWTKEFVVSKILDFPGGPYPYGFVRPIKVFKDGDFLMSWGVYFLFYYSKKNKTTQIIGMFQPGRRHYIKAILHNPSFISLKNLGIENAISL